MRLRFWKKKTFSYSQLNPYPGEVRLLRQKKKRLRSYRKHVQKIQRLARPFLAKNGTPGVTCISIGVDGVCVQGILIHFRASSLQDIGPIYRAIREAGYKRVGEPSDYAELKRRTYDFSPVQLMVFFEMEKEGPGCRVVKVGEEMKDVLKIICDTDIEEAAL